MKKIKSNEIVTNKLVKTDAKLYGYIPEKAKDVANKIYIIINKSEVDQGGIILVVGPQSSGKSLVGMELIEKLDGENLIVAAAQPKVDRPDVPEGKLFSRVGYEIPAVSFQTKKEIEKIFHKNDVVVIDEIQFVPTALQSFLLKEMRMFRDRGGWVIALGLLYTSLGTEFLISSVLKDETTATFQLKSTCQMCGRRNAIYNQRLVKGKPAANTAPDLMPPSSEVIYEPRCQDCYVVVGE